MRVYPPFDINELAPEYVAEREIRAFSCGRCKGKGVINKRVDYPSEFCDYCQGSGLIYMKI